MSEIINTEIINTDLWHNNCRLIAQVTGAKDAEDTRVNITLVDDSNDEMHQFGDATLSELKVLVMEIISHRSLLQKKDFMILMSLLSGIWLTSPIPEFQESP